MGTNPDIVWHSTPLESKLRKCDTRIIVSHRKRSDGVRLYRVIDEPRFATLFGPAPMVDCVAWRKENTA